MSLSRHFVALHGPRSAPSAAEPSVESFAATWARRAVTIPGLLLLTVLDVVLLPLLLVAATAVDLAKRRRFVAVRFQLALCFVLLLHTASLFLLFGTWLIGARWAGAPPERERRLDSRIEAGLLQCAWKGASLLYGIHLSVEGADALKDGPVVLMMRHASVLDILLPPVLLAGRPDLSLRYVIKRELLLRDPAVDVIGHHLPCTFVRRDKRNPSHEIALVATLARDLHPSDVVVIFPEGTRFTPTKRERSLAWLAHEDPEAYERAKRLKNVLLPHPGGPLALIERLPSVDVGFCAHTGLESANHLRGLARGALVRATVRVRLWRVSAADIPRTREARLEWLRDAWERMDAWITGTPASH